MSYYLQDSNPIGTGTYPDIADLFPDGVQTKSELVNALDGGFEEFKKEGITVNWVSYWTGFNANAGTVYALSLDYANQIGYNGPTTAKTQNFILVLDKYIEQNLRDLVAKSVNKSFNDMVKMQRNKNIEKKLQYHTNGTFYVDVEKTDGEGRSLGGIYVGRVTDGNEAVNIVVDSLDKCGSNLVVDNGFSVSKYGNLGEYIKSVAEYMQDVPDISEPLEEVINFQINVSIKIGKK